MLLPRSAGSAASGHARQATHGVTYRGSLVAVHAAGRRDSGGKQQQRRTGAAGAPRQQQQQQSQPLNAGVAGMARSAAKSANRFSRQRMRRMTQGGSSSDGGDSAGGEDGSPGTPPFQDVLMAHLEASSGSSSSPTTASTQDSGRGRGARRGAARALMEAYLAAFATALDLELEEEWDEAERRLQFWPKERLAAEGVALFSMSAAPDGAIFRDSVLKFFRPNAPLPYHTLTQGDIVLISKGEPGEESLEGVVVDYSTRWLRVALPTQVAAHVRGAGWRLDLYADTTSHERAQSAIRCFATPALGGSSGGSSSARAGAAGAGGPDAEADGRKWAGPGQPGEGLWRVLAGSLTAGTSLEQAAAAQPPWARADTAARERLAAAKNAARALASPTRGNRGGSSSSSNGSGNGSSSYETSTAGNGAETLAGSNGSSGENSSSGSSSSSSSSSRGRPVAQLNPSQARAVETALGRTLTLWQGPPGTGKTRTLLRLCAAALPALPVGGQLLAVAASNVAVDNVVSGLLELGVKVVRVGQPVKVSPELRRVTIEALSAATTPGARAADLRRRAASAPPGDAVLMWRQAMELEEEAAAIVLAGAQVVAATCIGAGDPRLANRSYPLVVVDEATQATEPASMVAIAGKAQSLLLVGDQQQLPPTVKSRRAERLGLGTSLFVRLQAMGLEPMLLDTQYRMHPAISAFPSAAFYGGRLLDAVAPSDRPLPTGFPWPNHVIPVAFISCPGPERRTGSSADDGQGFSYENPSEATAVARAVRGVIGGGLEGSEVCVISPYAGQVRLLQQMLLGGGAGAAPPTTAAAGGADGGASSGSARQRQQQQQKKKSSSSVGRGGEPRESGNEGGDGPRRFAGLEVKTVDGFQGREKEVVVFSAVRSNPSGSVGFLSDSRRLNVALTRARRGLIVVGDPATLSRDPAWRAWLAWARAVGAFPAGQQGEGGEGGTGNSSSAEAAAVAAAGGRGRGRRL